MPDGIEVLPSRAGAPTFRVRDAAGRDLWVHSPYDPEAEARRIVEALPPHDALLVAGAGLGHVLRAAAGGEILAVEADEAVEAAARPHRPGGPIPAGRAALEAASAWAAARRGRRVAAVANAALAARAPEFFVALEEAVATALGTNPLGPALGRADLDGLARRAEAARRAGRLDPAEAAAWLLDRVVGTTTRRERGFE